MRHRAEHGHSSWPRIGADRPGEYSESRTLLSRESLANCVNNQAPVRVHPRPFRSSIISGCLILGALPLAGCQRQSPPAEPARLPVVQADSLALRVSDGLSVWFTDSRTDRDSAGVSCTERVLQIRRDTLRTSVPLLYTGKAPVLLNDSTIEADLWLHCRPIDRYRVDLRSGRPVRVPR